MPRPESPAPSGPRGVPTPYPVPVGPVDAEIEIRASRFLAWLRPARSREAARAVIEAARAAFPDASHHCYAYLVGSPAAGEAAMSDDGEPSGTAGRPIFTVIGHKGVGDVIVVVTRYFGGVKLGAGGLVRAYMAAAEAVLSQMVVETALPMTQRTLLSAFADEAAVRHWCSGHDADILDVHYTDRVRLELGLPLALAPELADFCAARGIELIGS